MNGIMGCFRQLITLLTLNNALYFALRHQQTINAINKRIASSFTKFTLNTVRLTLVLFDVISCSYAKTRPPIRARQINFFSK